MKRFLLAVLRELRTGAALVNPYLTTWPWDFACAWARPTIPARAEAYQPARPGQAARPAAPSAAATADHR